MEKKEAQKSEKANERKASKKKKKTIIDCS